MLLLLGVWSSYSLLLLSITTLRFLAVLPLAGLLFLGVACFLGFPTTGLLGGTLVPLVVGEAESNSRSLFMVTHNISEAEAKVSATLTDFIGRQLDVLTTLGNPNLFSFEAIH